MAGQVRVEWPTCEQDDCIGIRVDSGKCLAHAQDQIRKAALEQIARTGVVDVRGVTVGEDLLAQILAAVPSKSDGNKVFAEAQFDGTTFRGDAVFDGATFQSDAGFDEATFEGAAAFSEAIFSDYAGFADGTFQSHARFDAATFKGRAQFADATFTRAVGFAYATFTGDAGFPSATFQGYAGFQSVTFRGYAGFGGVTFEGDSVFDRAAFRGYAGFDGAIFQCDARFAETTFDRPQEFGPVLVYGSLNLDGVQFAQPVVVEASTPRLSCQRARFPAGVQFRLQWAETELDDTDLSAPSLITGDPPLHIDGYGMAKKAKDFAERWRLEHSGQLSEQPLLMSVRRANVAGLSLSNVNLAECRFAGVHNLDLLRLEAEITLGLSPARAGWERRQVIAEEAQWRASRSRPGRWTAAQLPVDEPTPLDPGAIAGLYRALRKGREDAKDEPGSADFYYGEMEMRRHTAGPSSEREDGSRGRVDRAVLTVYWLVSGYGLRAWRSFTWFAAATAVFGLVFHLVGFTKPPQPVSYWTSLLYAFRSTLSLTDDSVNLTSWGQLLQALLRLTGPVLLGLGLLALRGRVRR